MRGIWEVGHCARHLLILAPLVSGPSFGQAPLDEALVPERPSCTALLPAIQATEVAPADAPRRRALLVGISEYTKLGSRNGDWSDLSTRCDVELMKQVLIGRYGFAPEHVKVLTEGQAERQAIVELFRGHLIQDARPGDVVVFYFSGHGQLIPDPKSWGGQRGSLVTADYVDGDARNGARTNLRSDTLRDLLRELKARMRKDPKVPDSEVEGNITVLLDSCHSGGGTKGLLKPKGRAWDPAKDGPIPDPEPGVRAKGAAGF
ncbi:MAG: caspase family protein, partial [Actinomycetota bacterium]|nr:caspase family protein [Actinomycetota bacterium]